MPTIKPKYSLIVFGASSFVGQILCHYLSQHLSKKVKWAMAGRSQNKLEALRTELGTAGADIPLLLADVEDASSLAELCKQTKVIISTVGPYALFGEAMIKACVEQGTDYCDLTGEVQWIKRMLDKYETSAQKSGARIVHCCGFDSIPSDMGVFFLQSEAKKRFALPCQQVKMRVKAIRGAASGGTVASLINVVKEAAQDPSLRRELADPYSICPKGHGYKTRQLNLTTGQYDTAFQSWITPFVMASINTRVVHRSNALAEDAYGRDFSYDEASLSKSGIKGFCTAQAIAGATAGFMLALAMPPSRRLIEKYLVPKPGEGPSKTTQEKGFYDLRFWGRTKNGDILRAKVTGDRDPGYGSTGKILAQAALCLAQDIGDDFPGGFWTPATIFGDKLLPRLIKDAGMEFQILA